MQRYGFAMSTLDDREPYPEPVKDEDGDYYLASEADAEHESEIADMRAGFALELASKDVRIRDLERELDVRKAAVEAQFELLRQVETLQLSNNRLRQKIDRLTRSL